jgi:hypothetical protein
MPKKPWFYVLFLALALPASPAVAADPAPLAFPGAVGPADTARHDAGARWPGVAEGGD